MGAVSQPRPAIPRPSDVSLASSPSAIVGPTLHTPTVSRASSLPSPLPPLPSAHDEEDRLFVALYDYTARSESEMSFQKGDLFRVKRWVWVCVCVGVKSYICICTDVFVKMTDIVSICKLLLGRCTFSESLYALVFMKPKHLVALWKLFTPFQEWQRELVGGGMLAYR